MGEPVSFSFSSLSEPEVGFAGAIMSCLYISVSEGARGCRQRGRQGGILCWKRWKAFNCKGVKDVGEEACRVTKVRCCEG